jgi:Uma2 family endonuclease
VTSAARKLGEETAFRPEWVLEDGVTMSEGKVQDEASETMVDVLKTHAVLGGLDWAVERNRALRWNAMVPQYGVDPDVMLVEPSPPPEKNLKGVKTWLPGHHPPRVAFEVVSEETAEEDYLRKPEKYALSGTHELWIFDPLLAGPRGGHGPHRLQVYRRLPSGALSRVYAGEGPAHSAELGAWLVLTDGGRKLRLADDPEGKRLWPTAAEAERAQKERERAEKESALRERDELLRRIAALEAVGAPGRRPPGGRRKKS